MISYRTRYLICGGRDFDDAAMVERALNALILHPAEATILHGAAHGADTLAARWGVLHGAATTGFPALWEKYGKAAGPKRNAEMLEVGKPDVVIAFPGGKGTANMIEQARAKGLVVVQVVA